MLLSTKIPVANILNHYKKPIIFSKARFHQVKNMTGLVEWFANNKCLRSWLTLLWLLVILTHQSLETEKKSLKPEIEKMHTLIKEYNLNSQFQWICAQNNRVRIGELYCYICDTRDAFV